MEESPAAGQAPVLVRRIDHVGIAVDDLDAALARLGDWFGLQVLHRERNDEQGVEEAVIVAGSPAAAQPASGVQLLQPLHEDSPVGRYLAKRGQGLHHLAFTVDDVVAAMAAMRERGVRVLSEDPRPGTHGSRIAFLHPADCGGVLIELVQPATES